MASKSMVATLALPEMQTAPTAASSTLSDYWALTKP